MRYASDKLSLFRTVFVQVAAFLLFAAGGMLLAAAEKGLDAGLIPHAEMAPAAELLSGRQLTAVLESQPGELPAPSEKSFQKKTRGLQSPFALSGFSSILRSERPVRLNEAASPLLPSWRGLVAFPLPPPASA